MNFRLRSSVVLLLLPLFGCTEAPSPPACRTFDATPRQHKTLACLIKADSDILLWQNAAGQLELPVALASDAEIEQYALHREIFAQTGVNIEVGKLLLTTKSDMGLYSCTQLAGIEESEDPFPSPTWAKEILSWVKRDAYNLTIREMENRDHLIPLRDGLSALFRQSHTDKE